MNVFRSTTENIQWRISLRILNEAARCLEENIISSPVCIDEKVLWILRIYFKMMCL